MDFNTARLSPKKHSEVGWVEERNPTFSGLCWVSLRSTQPTNLQNLRSIEMDLNSFQQVAEAKWLDDIVICSIFECDRSFAIVNINRHYSLL